jgi:hypothetical protein
MPHRRLLLGFALFAATMLLLGWWMLRLLVVAQGGEPFGERFGSVTPGAMREDVVELLGRPDRRSRMFYAPRAGMAAYRRAASANAHYYLYWLHRRAYYAIAFDNDDRVLFTLFLTQG